tara:strand:+ start:10106 stop:10552 length:447 start_codon:yes stop_codon:yes gene_type:complete
MGNISKNFSSWEFVPPEIDESNRPNEWYISEFQVKIAQFIRDRFGKPVYINTYKLSDPKKLGLVFTQSGTRLCSSNIGSLLSQHGFKSGVDLKIIGINYEEIRQDIRDNFKLYHDATGLTTIEKDTETWLHCDNRNTTENKLFEVAYK